MNPSSEQSVTPRAVLYGRVSAVMGRGDDLISPELQEHAVRSYCKRLGYEPVLWLCDIDKSGSEWSRRQVEQAVRMIEAKEADLIVVPRWSRFTRNLRDYVMQTARIEAAGGRVESVQEETDPATAAGLLQRDLFAILAQWESRKIGEAWRETHQRRRRAGLPHDGRARLGYQLVDGSYTPHPSEGPIVVSLYRRYLAGAGTATLADWLAQQGIGSSRAGKQWTGCGVRGFMRSGFAAGLIRVGDGYLPGAQTPLISQKTWDRFCAERAARYPKRPQTPAPSTALAGLVYCGNCGHRVRLRARSSKHGRVSAYIYLCERRTCENQIWITRHVLEAQIKGWFEQLATGADPASPVLAAHDNRLELEGQLRRIDAGLLKNRVDHAMGEYNVVTRNQMETALKGLADEVRRRISRSVAGQDATINTSVAVEIVTHWQQWTPQQLNEALRLTIRRITVLRLPGPRQRSISVDAA
jgi:site-specific DNA recombinase